jgi:chromosome segregation ATPase
MARQQAGTRAARISELEADLAAARRERDEAVTKALMERLVSKGLEAAHRVHLQGERDVAREDCRVSHTVERQRIVALETRLEHAELQQHSLTAGIELANERRQEAESEAAALRERLNLARQAILRDGYFNPAQVSDDIAPRILERVAALRERVGRLEAALRHAAIRDHPHTDWCRGCENVAAALAPAPAKSEGVA